MKSFRISLKNVAAMVAFFTAVMMFAVSCEKSDDNNPTGEVGEEFTIPDDGKVPSMVIPDEIRALLEENMPIYSGKTPPDIKGEYLADSKILTGSNYPPDVIGKSYLDHYIAFTKGADEAWTSAERGEAYVFTDIGTYTRYKLENNIWSYNGIGSYKLNGTSLTLNAVGYPFSVTTSSLKITIDGAEYTFTRTKPFKAGELDKKLILPQGQAWVMKDDYGLSSGYIFNADGTYGYYWGTWTLTSQGTWNTSGNTLVINQTGIGSQSYTYTVANSTLTVRNAFGDQYVYTQQPIPSSN